MKYNSNKTTEIKMATGSKMTTGSGESRCAEDTIKEQLKEGARNGS